jgi:hypothetical protein
MNKNFAQIVDNIVVNVVIATEEWILAQPGQWQFYEEEDSVGIGWEFINGEFTAPEITSLPFISLDEALNIKEN